MRKILVLIVLMVTQYSLISQNISAIDIIKKADSKLRGNSAYSEFTMIIIRPTYKRSISMKAWTKGNKYALIKILSPAKEKGQGFLKREKELWNWIPSIDRMIKMSSSIMSQSWMGSDLSNDDMIRESSMVNDYNHKLIKHEIIRGLNSYKLELIPKPNSAIVWGKVNIWIDKEYFTLVRIENYDQDNILVQTIEYFDLKTFGDRILPSRMEISPSDKKSNKTTLITNKADFNIKINESFFSQQNLKNTQ
ncbi:MAG: rane protein [Bacteroidetes bacterium]|nr:rane protein [Bacteroidota bacterium]